MLRLFQVKNTDSVKQLLKGADAAALRRVQALNPHLDITRAKAGSVLLLPDSPAFSAGDQASVSADAWQGLASDATAGLKARSEELKATLAQRETERKEVVAALKSAAVKRQLDADAGLRKQADTAEAQFKADQKAASDTARQLETMSEALAGELSALGALFK